MQRLLRGDGLDIRNASAVKPPADRARRRGSIVLVGRSDGAENREKTDDKPRQIAQVLRANQIVGPERVVGVRTMVPEVPMPEARRLSTEASAMHKNIVDECDAISILNPLPIRVMSRRRESPYDVLLAALAELQEEVSNVEPGPGSPAPCLVVVTDVRYAATVFGHRVPALIDLGDGNLIGQYEVSGQ